jgi:uncharacterized protein YwbE
VDEKLRYFNYLTRKSGNLRKILTKSAFHPDASHGVRFRLRQPSNGVAVARRRDDQ